MRDADVDAEHGDHDGHDEQVEELEGSGNGVRFAVGDLGDQLRDEGEESDDQRAVDVEDARR